MSRKPTLRATPLLLVVLCLTIWHAFRLWTAIAWYDVLREFSPVPGPVYIALSAAVWLALGVILLWSIWQRKAWAAKMLIGAAAGYTVWYWADRLAFQGPRANWPFALLVNLVLLLYVLALTFSQHTMIKSQREAYERESEGETPA